MFVSVGVGEGEGEGAVVLVGVGVGECEGEGESAVVGVGEGEGAGAGAAHVRRVLPRWHRGQSLPYCILSRFQADRPLSQPCGGRLLDATAPCRPTAPTGYAPLDPTSKILNGAIGRCGTGSRYGRGNGREGYGGRRCGGGGRYGSGWRGLRSRGDRTKRRGCRRQRRPMVDAWRGLRGRADSRLWRAVACGC